MVHKFDLLYRGDSHPSLDLMHRDCLLTLRTCAWDEATRFKPIAELDPRATPREHGDPAARWRFHLPGVVRAAGIHRLVTFINRPSDWHAPLGEPTPYEMLRQRMWQRANHDFPERKSWFEPGYERGPIMPRPMHYLAVQGVLYTRGIHDDPLDPQPASILMLPPSAAQSLHHLLADHTWRTKLLDQRDPTMLEIVQAAWSLAGEPRWEVVHDPNPPAMPSDDSFGLGHFHARLVCPLDPRIPVPAAKEMPALVPWDGVFKQLTVHQQFELLAAAFSVSTVIGAIQDTTLEPMLPDWMWDV